jgi:hypothetical protein
MVSTQHEATAQVANRCDSLLIVSGRVTDGGDGVIPAAMVVNQSANGGGQFVDFDGGFLLAACPGDTLAFGALGFHTVQRVLPSHTGGFDMRVRLKRLQVQIGLVEVVAPRDLREILNDIEELGYEEEDFHLTRVDALQSPITYLYQMFSRTERSKRLVAEMENNDKRRELLRELLSKYADYEIVHLADDEFDSFVDFVDPGDELLQLWTQYEFILYVKRRFHLYQSLPRKMEDGDYQYHLD